MIDTHSKRTDAHRLFRATLRWVARLVLVSIAGSWLFLYLDSVYQRRRAEALFADLKSLDFATAGFHEARDIMIRYGGHAQQSQPLPRFPDLGDPIIDDHGNVTFTKMYWPFCTLQNCTFLLQTTTWLARYAPGPGIALSGKARFLYTTLPYIGVRSWGVGAIFRIRNGKLDTSQTMVSEERMERLDSSGYRYLVSLGYDVMTGRDAASSEPGCDFSQEDYRVYVSHWRGLENMLTTCVLQSARIPVKRAFEVRLRCFSNLFRSCSFEELAPSAWADYSSKDGTGTRDPHK